MKIMEGGGKSYIGNEQPSSSSKRKVVGPSLNLIAQMVKDNLKTNQVVKQVKTQNAKGDKNPQGGRGNEVSKGGKANFKKLVTLKI